MTSFIHQIKHHIRLANIKTATFTFLFKNLYSYKVYKQN